MGCLIDELNLYIVGSFGLCSNSRLQARETQTQPWMTTECMSARKRASFIRNSLIPFFFFFSTGLIRKHGEREMVKIKVTFLAAKKNKVKPFFAVDLQAFFYTWQIRSKVETVNWFICTDFGCFCVLYLHKHKVSRQRSVISTPFHSDKINHTDICYMTCWFENIFNH